VKQAAIRKAFEDYLKTQSLRLTPQRIRIFDRAFATHDHFSAETFYGWLRAEDGPSVSRATIYRTLALLVDGGFLDSFDGGKGELVYEHVMGHRHHDHLVCIDCGKIEEFFDERIERIQSEVADQHGFELVEHDHRLRGYCRACSRARKRDKAPAEGASGATQDRV
jgi:Fur family ferric uptake transcriptional regulator